MAVDHLGTPGSTSCPDAAARYIRYGYSQRRRGWLMDGSVLLALLDPAVVLRANTAAASLVRASAGAPALAPEIHGSAAVANTFKGRARAAQLALIEGDVGLVVRARWQAHGGVRLYDRERPDRGDQPDRRCVEDRGAGFEDLRRGHHGRIRHAVATVRPIELTELGRLQPRFGGFMFGRSVEDPDGNVWEIIWMDAAAPAPHA